jgi:hypothetical protein
VLSCVGRGLCDGLITRPEESYRVSVCVCDQETLKREAKGLSWTISACDDDDDVFRILGFCPAFLWRNMDMLRFLGRTG